MAGFCPHCMTDHATGAGICPACGGNMDAQNAPHQLPAGSTLLAPGDRRYLVGAALGEGGFGITYVCREEESRRLVAIKEFYPTRCELQRQGDGSVFPSDRAQEMYHNGKQSFLNEAGMLAAVENIPSVVKVLDFFEANGTAYMVMEYLRGETLQRRIERGGAMSFDELMTAMRPLLEDMCAMHQAGIIHRDIAPDNIMLLEDGGMRLMDFGCARFTEDGKSMTVMLKPGFAPLEQYTRRGQKDFTDVYGVCATIYYCITGRVPDAAADRLENDPLVPPSSLGAQISPEEEQMLLWGMSVQPKARPQTMRAFLEHLRPAEEKPQETDAIQEPPHDAIENTNRDALRDSPLNVHPAEKTDDGAQPWWRRISRGNLPLIGIAAAVLLIILAYSLFRS